MKKKIKNKKMYIDDSTKELEKRVKKKQIINILTLVPLVIVGAVLETLILNEKESTKEEKSKKINYKRKSKKEEQVEEKKESKENKKYKKVEPKKEVIYTIEEEKRLEEKISKVKDKKLIEEYENKLKDIRIKLRNHYYEEDIINEIKKLENSPSRKNLDKLNKIIEKLDEYKNNIKTDELVETESNYISVLVEEDIEKLINNKKDKKIINNINDKVEEIKKYESIIKEKIDKEKEAIEEEKIEEIKEKKQSIKKHFNELIKFQNEQDLNLKNTKEKIKKEVNNLDIKRIQLSGIAIGTAITLNKVKKQMTIPGVRSSKKLFNFLTIGLYYIGLITAVKPINRKYKSIEVEDYSKDIESNLKEIDKVLSDINKTKDKIDKVLNKLKKDYKELEDSKEFIKIVKDLEEMQKQLEEKQYEIERIKENERKKQLNTDKVYKLN